MKAPIWPKPCPVGEQLALLAPAAAVSQSQLAAGHAWLADAGWSVQTGAHLFDSYRYLSASDQDRAADLNAAIRSPEIAGIIAARGGYGCMRILDAVDWQAWAVSRKPLVGFSDVTALQLALYQRCRLVSYSGFAPAADIGAHGPKSQRTVASMQTLLSGRQTEALGATTGVYRVGEARGPVLGGCLSLIVALLGTPWLPDLEGAILILEDVGEKPYAIDRMLTQLQLAGIWKKVAAVVFGSFHNCPDPNAYLPEICREVAARVDGPVVFGAPYGHQPERAVIPVGATGTLSAGVDGWSLEFADASHATDCQLFEGD